MSWGEIYNTSWWGVALDTARTVKARPDFFGSQLNLLTSEQPNLVTNGDFATDSDWTKGTGWSISNGKAISNSSTSSIYQATGSNYTSGKTYKIVFTVSDYVSGSVRPEITNVIGSNVSSNGTFTQYIVATSSPIGEELKAVNFVGSIDNVSVQVARAELDQIEAKKCLADWIHTTALKDLNN